MKIQKIKKKSIFKIFPDMLLETDDIAFMLVQYEHEAESTTVAASTSES